jgi:hypothetical protein
LALACSFAVPAMSDIPLEQASSGSQVQDMVGLDKKTQW